MNGRVNVIVYVASDPSGALRLSVQSVYPNIAFTVQPSSLALNIWNEGDDSVRISILHGKTRTLAYLQGNRALRELCANLGLNVQSNHAEVPKP